MDNYGWIWLGLALVNAGLAEQKNRSRWTWFVVSLLLGPLATAMIVVWKPPTNEKAPPLHPFTNATDRFLVFGSAALIGAVYLGLGGLVTQEQWLWICAAAFAVAFLAQLSWYLVARRTAAKLTTSSTEREHRR